LLAARLLDQVGLVHDVNQVQKFGDTPEDLADAGAQFPVLGLALPVKLSQVEVGAGRVGLVEAEEGFDGEALPATGPLVIELRLGEEGKADLAGSRREAGAGEQTGFRGDAAGEQGSILGVCGKGKEQEGETRPTSWYVDRRA